MTDEEDGKCQVETPYNSFVDFRHVETELRYKWQEASTKQLLCFASKNYRSLVERNYLILDTALSRVKGYFSFSTV